MGKVAWDVVLAFTGVAGFIAGVIGFVVGAVGYEAHCTVPGFNNCFMEGGEVFGLYYAGSQMDAALLTGAIFAAVGGGSVGWLKVREQSRKAQAELAAIQRPK